MLAKNIKKGLMVLVEVEKDYYNFVKVDNVDIETNFVALCYYYKNKYIEDLFYPLAELEILKGE